MTETKIGKVLTRVKKITEVKDEKEYRRVTIRTNHKGVTTRDLVKGHEIKTKRQFSINAGNFIVSRIDARNGAFGIVPEELQDAIITGDFLAFDINSDLINLDYFYLYTKTNDFLDKCIRSSKGTTNRKRLKEEIFLNMDFELPSLKEQEKIVEKYKQIENQNKNLLNSLTETREYIKHLKESILSDAMQGKLVPQNPKDEPASELLEKIKMEKKKAIEEKKVRKEKVVAKIGSEEILFKLPVNWSWVRVGNIISTSSGGTPSRGVPSFWEGDIPWLKSGELNDNLNIKKSEETITESGLKNSSAKIFEKGTVVLALYGATAGKLGILGFNTTTNQAICNFYKSKFIQTKYLFYFLLWSRNKIISECFGGAQPNISQDYVRNMLFPLAPLEEQKRIVAKIDFLMSLVDGLEREVLECESNSNLLRDAVLHDSFEINSGEVLS